MTILSARDIRRTYGIQEVLRGASASLDAGERVGLVGRNGCGKSTFAKILAGAEEADGGEVVSRSGLRIGYLAQEPQFPPGVRAVDAVLAGLSDWQTAMDRYEVVSSELGEASEAALTGLLEEQADLVARIEQLGGWEKRHEALALLSHLGVREVEAPVDRMSGGERRRVALARLLVASPDLAILDEPTNHLDLETVEWLERWLADRFKGALILVTHDRYLLDRVAKRTWEIEDGELHCYEGGWGRYLEAKAEREAHAGRVESNRRNFLRRELEWLSRSPKARSTKQKARIDRVEAVRDQVGPKRQKDATIELGHTREGRTIIDADSLEIGIGDRSLLKDVTLRLSKGERVGIVGPNGCGKTTLLRVLTGQLEPWAGELRMGKRTKIAFLEQSRGGLDDSESIYENVGGGQATVTLGGQELDMRTYLERFLFDSRDQRRTVGTLSGGERARVALAKTLREGANLVILDEPTNDLDVMTLTALEVSLREYPGALLVVTHDRWFLDRVATALLVFEDGRLVRHEGGWADYRARINRTNRTKTEAAERTSPEVGESAGLEARDRGARPTRAETERPKKAAPVRSLTYGERIELETLLEQVDGAEQTVAGLEAELAEAGFYDRNVAEQKVFFAALAAARAEAERLAERWTELEALAE